ncbi:hypothetical protein [Pendulispora albinea]|uniref:Uncharacterized protein n=1 Tax=Pendulispora albinea TaxID=2741071 RepID=A0ABZ2MAF3_9BACT
MQRRLLALVLVLVWARAGGVPRSLRHLETFNVLGSLGKGAFCMRLSDILPYFKHSLLLRFAFWFGWGLLTKVIDLHFDDKLFRRDIVVLLAVLCGVTVGLGMASDGETTVLYGAIIASCFLSRKIDNMAFHLSTALVGITFLAVHATIGVDLKPTLLAGGAFALLTFGYVVDEKLNDRMDRHREMQRSPSRLVRWTYMFLKHRCVSVVCELVVLLLGAISFFGLIQAALFNAGYYAMYLIGKVIMERRHDIAPLSGATR